MKCRDLFKFNVDFLIWTRATCCTNKADLQTVGFESWNVVNNKADDKVMINELVSPLKLQFSI
jgi:hypothetical protein